jgi:hypothetical protein
MQTPVRSSQRSAEGAGDTIEGTDRSDAPPPRPEPRRVVRVSALAKVQRATSPRREELAVYARKTRARLKAGVKHRGKMEGFKVEPLPLAVAQLVTVDVVAQALDSGVCGLCEQTRSGLSVQCIRWVAAPPSADLAALCRSCTEDVHVRRVPQRQQAKREVPKLYTLWRKETEKRFDANGQRLRYFKETMQEMMRVGPRRESELKIRIGAVEWELMKRLCEDGTGGVVAMKERERMKKADDAAFDDADAAEQCGVVLGSDGLWREM